MSTDIENIAFEIGTYNRLVHDDIDKGWCEFGHGNGMECSAKTSRQHVI